jgi:hypothetical protein
VAGAQNLAGESTGVLTGIYQDRLNADIDSMSQSPQRKSCLMEVVGGRGEFDSDIDIAVRPWYASGVRPEQHHGSYGHRASDHIRISADNTHYLFVSHVLSFLVLLNSAVAFARLSPSATRFL